MQNQEYRKVQGLVGEQSFSSGAFSLKSYAVHLGIDKGDFVKIREENRSIVIEKA